MLVSLQARRGRQPVLPRLLIGVEHVPQGLQDEGHLSGEGGMDLDELPSPVGQAGGGLGRMRPRGIARQGDLCQAPLPPATAEAREALARRLAKGAETSLKAAERDDVQSFLTDLAAHLAVLAPAATPHLEAAARARVEQEAAEAGSSAPAPDSDALAELKVLLAGRRMAAVARYQQLAPTLRGTLSGDDFSHLEAAMERSSGFQDRPGGV